MARELGMRGGEFAIKVGQRHGVNLVRRAVLPSAIGLSERKRRVGGNEGFEPEVPGGSGG